MNEFLTAARLRQLEGEAAEPDELPDELLEASMMNKDPLEELRDVAKRITQEEKGNHENVIARLRAQHADLVAAALDAELEDRVRSEQPLSLRALLHTFGVR